MKITILSENISGNVLCKAEHGLSIYIETKKHKILLDTGASELFWENAKNLGVDLKEVDVCVLSHGHYDHSDGLLRFREINRKAPIYMRENAGEGYYHGERYIGINLEILKLPGIAFLEGDRRLDEELSLYTNVKGRRLWPQGNGVLSHKSNEVYEQDDFSHEQYLVIEEEGKKVLISGCAHNGILNILEKYQEIWGEYPNIVFSGFHMMKQVPYTAEEIAIIEETAAELKKMPTTFYTGHCTGEVAYEIMKKIMGDTLCYMSCGARFEV